MIFGAGVDVGSTQTKAVIVDESRRIVARSLISTGANVTRAGENAFVKACGDAGLPREAVGYVVGTGYGRYKVTFGDTQITEITCHGRGAHSVFPATRTVIDMGGQDTKAIKVGPDGSVVDFSMNDKCAAGTGRFLSAAADVTGVSLDEIGPLALEAKSPVRLTSVCTVFVESDIMSYLAQRKTIEDILGGVHKAIATRTMSLVRRVGVEEEVTFTGGVSRNVGMVRALEAVLGVPINVSDEGHFMGALGAALFALERAQAAVHGTPVGAGVAGCDPCSSRESTSARARPSACSWMRTASCAVEAR
jgi:predicted CoA-substrate-specific enzyme activase